VAIKVCFKASKTVIQTVEMVHTACGDEAVMRYNVFGWYGWIRVVREDVQGNPLRWIAKSKNVRQLLLQNCTLSL